MARLSKAKDRDTISGKEILVDRSSILKNDLFRDGIVESEVVGNPLDALGTFLVDEFASRIEHQIIDHIDQISSCQPESFAKDSTIFGRRIFCSFCANKLDRMNTSLAFSIYSNTLFRVNTRTWNKSQYLLDVVPKKKNCPNSTSDWITSFYLKRHVRFGFK